MKWQGFALLAILVSEDLQGAGIGWMKVDSNGRATPAEHQVKIQLKFYQKDLISFTPENLTLNFIPYSKALKF